MPMIKKNTNSIQKIIIPHAISSQQEAETIHILHTRFEANLSRHKAISWDTVKTKLAKNPSKLRSLFAMEITGGEPDVIGYEKTTNEFLFCDCSPETPSGRKNICYDRAGEEKRIKQGITPAGNAVDLASAIGISLIDEKYYRILQTLGVFDTKTSSWILTPPSIRELDGALFVDRRFNTVFVYHNTASTFYGSRGFRGVLKV